MNKISFHIEADPLFESGIRYTIQLIATNKRFVASFVEQKELADVRVGTSPEDTLQIDRETWLRFSENHFAWQRHFRKEPLIQLETTRPDYLTSIFYLINCLQEFNIENENLDEWGRFRYDKSSQFHFGAVTRNLCQEYIEEIMRDVPVLAAIPQTRRNSTVLISHDIDFLHLGWKEDGKWALRKMRPDLLLYFIWREIIRKPHWLNIDRILNMHSEKDIHSTFLWITEHGMDASSGIPQADYQIQHQHIQQTLRQVRNQGSENGLHKSTLAKPMKAEREPLKRETPVNRYHFLKFKLPSAWDELEDAGMETDLSLGFSEHIGFRNNYGLPFQPFNLKTGKPYSFLEAGTQVMDASLMHYMHLNPQQALPLLLSFFEQNRENCVFSVLWHNNFLTPYFYKEYLDLYKKLLLYFYEQQFEYKLSTDLSEFRMNPLGSS